MTSIPTYGLSKRQERAPWLRPLRFFLAAIALIIGKAYAGWLEPQVRTFESCIEESIFLAAELKRQSRSSKLYFTRFIKDGAATDDQMFSALGVAGMISSLPLLSTDLALEDEQRMLFTGTVHKRKASTLERFLGGGRDRIFYEVELLGQRAILNASSFVQQPIAVCEQALEAESLLQLEEHASAMRARFLEHQPGLSLYMLALWG